MFSVLVQAADIRTYVDRTNISVGESVNLTVTVSGSDAKVDVTPIRDFKVASRGTSTSVRIVNSRMSREISHKYMLVPLREGRLVIPPLTVEADGKTFQTKAIVVQVSKQPPAIAGRSDLLARAKLSDNNPYEGQQIIYTFRLFTAVRLANAKLQKPDFSGFIAKEISDTKSYQKVVDGRQYTVSELSYVLVPLKPGEVVIKPSTFRCDLIKRRKRSGRSFFDSFLDDSFIGQAELEPKILTTEPLTVDVKPLPSSSGEVRFSGLVGRFEMQAKLEDAEINVGDSTTLTLTVAGTGNIMDAVQPQVAVPDAFKVYGDNPEEQITVNESGFSGKKVFRIALVAVKPGIYTIKPAKISYFDIPKEKYMILSTPSFSLTANPPTEKESVQAFSAPAGQDQLVFKKKKVEFTGRDILPLKEELAALESRKDMSLFLFIILLTAPPLLYLTVIMALKFFKESEAPGSIMAQRAEKALKQAPKIEASNEEFLACLYRALVSAIFASAGTRGESLTYAEAEEILLGCGHSDSISKQAAELLRKIESVRYGGLNQEAVIKGELLSETKQLVRSLLRKGKPFVKI